MPYDEPNNIIRDNKEDMSVTDKATSGDRNMIKKETEKIKNKNTLP